MLFVTPCQFRCITEVSWQNDLVLSTLDVTNLKQVIRNELNAHTFISLALQKTTAYLYQGLFAIFDDIISES